MRQRPPAGARQDRSAAAAVVIVAGACAALHVGKLAPAIVALQAGLGLTLVEAGFLLSLVQLAGMTSGVAFGVLADGLGLRRSLLIGLVVLAAASAAGGVATSVAALMVLRAVEGFGFLLVVLPAPGLVRGLVAPARLAAAMGLWGAYMPAATALALLVGPSAIEAFGWRAWWWALAGVSAAMVLGVLRAVPADRERAAPASAADAALSASAPVVARSTWTARLRRTLGARGPWLLAFAFACYSGQWLAVVGFLPTIYRQAGVPVAWTGLLTAVAAAVNMAGNVGSGRLLQRGAPPPRLLAIGYLAMAFGSFVAFVEVGQPASIRYLAVLAFSGVGGLIPGTLFALVARFAPGEDTLSSTVGWMQQWSAFGQFAGPPALAWIAAGAGGWHLTWLATGASALAGLALARRIGRESRASRASTG